MASKKTTGKGSSKKMVFESKAKSSSKSKRHSLQPLRDKLRGLLDRANKIISRLTDNGTLYENPAFQEAMATKSRAKDVSDELFSIDDKKSFRSLAREANRMLAFVSHPSTTRDYKHHWLNLYNQHETYEQLGKRFNVGEENEERLKLAFRIFRDIATTEVSAIGKDAYGSDNLINLIYDSLEDYQPGMSKRKEDALSKKAHDIAYEAIQTYNNNLAMGFFSDSTTINKEVDLVSRINESMTADEFFKKNKKFLGNNW